MFSVGYIIWSIVDFVKWPVNLNIFSRALPTCHLNVIAPGWTVFIWLSGAHIRDYGFVIFFSETRQGNVQTDTTVTGAKGGGGGAK
jgi:hypothetical protein